MRTLGFLLLFVASLASSMQEIGNHDDLEEVPAQIIYELLEKRPYHKRPWSPGNYELMEKRPYHKRPWSPGKRDSEPSENDAANYEGDQLGLGRHKKDDHEDFLWSRLKKNQGYQWSRMRRTNSNPGYQWSRMRRNQYQWGRL